jgi:hypothetical protein
MQIRGFAVLITVFGLAQPVLADAFRAPKLRVGAPTSIQAYGKQNPTCLEWTNGCVICVSENGRAQCSTPGIACSPAGITCKRVGSEQQKP